MRIFKNAKNSRLKNFKQLYNPFFLHFLFKKRTPIVIFYAANHNREKQGNCYYIFFQQIVQKIVKKDMPFFTKKQSSHLK